MIIHKNNNMKKFLKYVLRPHWKIIIIILILSGFQTYFQLGIIDLFNSALNYVEQENMGLILNICQTMLVYTILSMICMLIISVIATNVSANCAYETRRKMFHILMNLPSEEVDKFRITDLIARITRSVYTEQGFIEMLLKNVLVYPFIIVGIVISITFIHYHLGLIFVAVYVFIFLILFFKMKKIIDIYFKVKKIYGKINLLFLKRINKVKNNIGNSNKKDFKVACDEAYDKNLEYHLNQYYIAPILFLILDGIIVIQLAMMSSGHSICIDSVNIVDSVVIIQYLLYFLTVLAFVPKLIYNLPIAYTNSVRIEEILDLEDKIDIKIKDKKINFNKFEFEKRKSRISRKISNISRRESRRKFGLLLSNHYFKFIFSFILLTISTLCIVYAPVVVGNIVNLFSNENTVVDHGVIVTNILLLAILYIVGYLLQMYSNRIMIFIGEKITYNIRRQIYDKVENSKITIEKSEGDILSRINNDLMNVTDFITVHASEIFAQLLSIILVIVLIWITDWKLSLIYFISIPIYAICFYHYDANSKKSYEVQQDLMGNQMEIIRDFIEKDGLINFKNQQKNIENDFETINFGIKKEYTSSRYHSGLMSPLATFLTNLRNIIIYICGIYLLMNGEIQLGTLLTIILYGKLLTTPIKKLSSSLTSVQTSYSSIKRVFEIIENNGE